MSKRSEHLSFSHHLCYGDAEVVITVSFSVCAGSSCCCSYEPILLQAHWRGNLGWFFFFTNLFNYCKKQIFSKCSDCGVGHVTWVSPCVCYCWCRIGLLKTVQNEGVMHQSFPRDEERVITLHAKLTRLSHGISAKHKLMFSLIIQLHAVQTFHFVGKSSKAEWLSWVTITELLISVTFTATFNTLF